MEHVVLEYFKEISKIPRGSGNNQGISDYLVGFAREHGLDYIQDTSLNVIIKKPATPGYETCPPMILQGHMDMVCEKTSESNHDFETDGLDLQTDGDYLYARETTLGADDGIAVAYSLAVLGDDSIVHPDLEVLITTDEEIGLLGAAALDVSSLKGKCMINIDSENEEELLVSCAGGLTAECKLPLTYEKTDGRRLTLTIKDLLGGHSGMEIGRNRINAAILLGRLLYDLRKLSFYVISLKSGTKDNAIPREAVAELVASDQNAYKIINEIKYLSEKYKNESRINEPGLNISVSQGEEKTFWVLTKESYDDVLFYLMSTPNGIFKMSPNIKDLVESSLNLGVFHTDEESATFRYSVRSSLSFYKEYLSNKLEVLIKKLGGTYGTSGDYPAWEFKKDSRLRTIYADAYERIVGKEIKIQAVHAGLECGIIAEKLGDIDIISIGPNMQDVHTTEERLSISSTIKVYEIILETMKNYCEQYSQSQ